MPSLSWSFMYKYKQKKQNKTKGIKKYSVIHPWNVYLGNGIDIDTGKH